VRSHAGEPILIVDGHLPVNLKLTRILRLRAKASTWTPREARKRRDSFGPAAGKYRPRLILADSKLPRHSMAWRDGTRRIKQNSRRSAIDIAVVALTASYEGATNTRVGRGLANGYIRKRHTRTPWVRIFATAGSTAPNRPARFTARRRSGLPKG